MRIRSPLPLPGLVSEGSVVVVHPVATLVSVASRSRTSRWSHSISQPDTANSPASTPAVKPHTSIPSTSNAGPW